MDESQRTHIRVRGGALLFMAGLGGFCALATLSGMIALAEHGLERRSRAA